MKIRSGFVSNSSSSSFIVAFDRNVTTKEKMYELFKASLIDNSKRQFERLFCDEETLTVEMFKEDTCQDDDEGSLRDILEKFNGNTDENIRVLHLNLDQCDESGDIELMEDFIGYLEKTKNEEVLGIDWN